MKWIQLAQFGMQDLSYVHRFTSNVTFKSKYFLWSSSTFFFLFNFQAPLSCFFPMWSSNSTKLLSVVGKLHENNYVVWMLNCFNTGNIRRTFSHLSWVAFCLLSKGSNHHCVFYNFYLHLILSWKSLHFQRQSAVLYAVIFMSCKRITTKGNVHFYFYFVPASGS